jgi:hypothetical protein
LHVDPACRLRILMLGRSAGLLVAEHSERALVVALDAERAPAVRALLKDALLRMAVHAARDGSDAWAAMLCALVSGHLAWRPGEDDGRATTPLGRAASPPASPQGVEGLGGLADAGEGGEGAQQPGPGTGNGSVAVFRPPRHRRNESWGSNAMVRPVLMRVLCMESEYNCSAIKCYSCRSIRLRPEALIQSLLSLQARPSLG